MPITVPDIDDCARATVSALAVALGGLTISDLADRGVPDEVIGRFTGNQSSETIFIEQ